MVALRVGFDTGPLHGPRTGIGHAVEALQRALAARDDVDVVPYLVSFRAEVEPPTVRLPLPAALAHRLWRHTAHPRVDRWLRDTDVIHGTNYVVAPTKKPSVVSVYDCWFLRHPDQAGASVRRAGAVLRAAVDRGAVVHASSDATADAVRELMPAADVHTIHLAALDLPPAADAAPTPEIGDHPFVVAIGTLERRKNLPRLVEGFGRIAADHPDLRLVIAGPDGDDADATRAAVDNLTTDVAARVLFTGHVDRATRAWLLRNATLVAYPSLDEGFGVPLLDAMRAEVPVVAASAGSIPEVAGGAALLCDPLDVDSIAGGLDRALRDESVRTSLIEAGRTRWREFSWERTAGEMVDLYRRIAA
jgi:glycosyltransferase involved in cell wall biosynthesis